MSITALDRASSVAYGGALITTGNGQALNNLRALPTVHSTVVSSQGRQPPAVQAVQASGGSGKAPELVASTKPQAPPTFRPIDDHSPVIQRPYAGPVFYTKAGAFSQPIQTLGHGAMVDITA